MRSRVVFPGWSKAFAVNKFPEAARIVCKILTENTAREMLLKVFKAFGCWVGLPTTRKGRYHSTQERFRLCEDNNIFIQWRWNFSIHYPKKTVPHYPRYYLTMYDDIVRYSAPQCATQIVGLTGAVLKPRLISSLNVWTLACVPEMGFRLLLLALLALNFRQFSLVLGARCAASLFWRAIIGFVVTNFVEFFNVILPNIM